jgi:hypothetical protein
MRLLSCIEKLGRRSTNEKYWKSLSKNVGRKISGPYWSALASVELVSAERTTDSYHAHQCENGTREPTAFLRLPTSMVPKSIVSPGSNCRSRKINDPR